MIVYRDSAQREAVAPRLDALARIAERQRARRRPDLEDARSLVVEFGILESAAADALFPVRDGLTPHAQHWRDIAVALGDGLRCAWRGEPWPSGSSLAARLRTLVLPSTLNFKEPEGFSHYGLFPETYLLAAERFAAAQMPDHVTCIGLRSIGCALSGVVAAALGAAGVAVRTCTVRPRGDPFARHLALEENLIHALRADAAGWFAIVDEGPGLSGSSFIGTALMLRALGVAEERIVLFPSWDPDPDRLRFPAAQRLWPRFRRYHTEFEALRPRLCPGMDLSAGAWRRRRFEEASRYPAVHPQHERRKYLQASSLARFTGFGYAGERKRVRAETLASAGFAPPVHGFAHGFLFNHWLVDALPARTHDAALLACAARYFAHLRRHHQATVAPSWDEWRQMLEINTRALLGAHAPALNAWLSLQRVHVDNAVPTAIDGRVQPHEWLRTAAGWMKTDGIDHHGDHFFPGPADVAWDLAGMSVEFALPPAARAALLASYARASGDGSCADRLPFYEAAYLAWRGAYAALAAATLKGSADGRRFAILTARYRRQLARHLRREC